MSGSRLDLSRGDVPGVLWPPLFSNQSASLAALLEHLERTQWLAAAELAAHAHRQLGALSSHFERHSPSFRQRLADAGLKGVDLASADGLRALPPLSRSQVQAKDPPIFCEKLPAGHAPPNEVRTSGSTGEPVVVRRTAVNRLHWAAMTLRYNLWTEPDFMGGICSIRANVKPGRTADWGRPFTFFFETGPGLRVDIQTDVRRQLELIEEFGPSSLVVYPSNLIALLEEMEVRGIELPTLRRIRTIGETVPDGLKELVRTRMSASLRDCYSSEEVGYIAMQCPEGDLYHLMSETLIVEVVDDDGNPCDEGMTGRILITDIHNYATPMIRYAIGDHAEVGPQCPCGRGMPTLRRILGRERNMIVKPDGTRHWPLTGFKQFREIAPVAQYQMRQLSLEKVEVRLVCERPLTKAEESRLRGHIETILGHSFAVEFAYFEGRLPLGANGKFEEFLRLF